jgi:drug/metabolite transporter (DMT)-like permease
MAAPTWKIWTALGLVYVVWGSTYLAIAYVVEGLPPLLTAAARFLVSALLLAGWVLLRRGREPFRASRRAWAAGASVGVLLLLGGNGMVMLAEDRGLPSGLTALLASAVPLFVVVLRWVTRDRPAAPTLVGVGLGFAGLAVLLLPGARPTGVPVFAAGMVVVGCALWSVGSFLAGRWTMPADPLVTSVAEMVGGGVGLALAGLLRGEGRPTEHVPASAWWAFGYLVLLGAVVGFTAYSWLLGNAPLSQVATYAYVNPVVAVALGAGLHSEEVSGLSLLGGLVTVAAVAVVVSAEGRRAYAPTERQGRLRSSAT